VKFSQAFRKADKSGKGIYRRGWGLEAVCYVNVDDLILENYSDNTKRTMMLTYKDIVSKDWEVCDRGAVKSFK
jgi:hypothetical protein